jgi:Family of unknown function (DUF6410)
MAREIGPLGTGSRIVGGTAAIAIPIVLHGFNAWDALLAFVVLPAAAVVAAKAITMTLERIAPGMLAKQHLICSAPGCLLITSMIGVTGVGTAMTSASGTVSLWVWLGSSMLLSAARGYAGCEVLALPSLLLGRRDRVGCLVYTPIDRWERAHRIRAGKASFSAEV